MRPVPAALAFALVAASALGGCASQSSPDLGATRARGSVEEANDPAVPPFARRGYAPFSRAAVVAIALREWRLFGSAVDDDPPGTRPPPLPDQKPERQEGLWQRVGEYWWTAIGPDDPHAAWTGKHDQTGLEFPAESDGRYAWSAAFISYVLRIAGAGAGFPYSESHSDYIDAAAAGATPLLSAERLSTYPPRPGDLVCLSRGLRHPLTFDDLPTTHRFPSHCDIVVGRDGNTLQVIGGNVDDAVTLKHIPVTEQGTLALPDGTLLDPRYTWLCALRVNDSQLISEAAHRRG